MKFKILLISATLFCLFSCRPSRETSKFVIETQLLENDTNIYQKFDLKYTKYDRKNKSYLEIAQVKMNDSTKFIFSSDVFANKVYVNLFTLSRGQEPFEKFNNVNYFVISRAEIFAALKSLEKISINKDKVLIDKLIYKSIRINNDIILTISGNNKPIFSDAGLFNFVYRDIEIWVGKRCHKIPYSEFKMLF